MYVHLTTPPGFTERTGDICVLENRFSAIRAVWCISPLTVDTWDTESSGTPTVHRKRASSRCQRWCRLLPSFPTIPRAPSTPKRVLTADCFNPMQTHREEGSGLTLCFWKQGRDRQGWGGIGGKQFSSHTGRASIYSQPPESPRSSLLKVWVSPFSNPSHGNVGRILDTHLINVSA